jgi:cell division transport system ATP-binding protein
LISLINISKEYPPAQLALRGININITPGEFIFVAGASGAGKSTLLKLLYGAETPSSGKIKVLGRDLNSISRRQLPFLRREIGIVFQDYKLLPRRSVAENIGFPLEVQGVNRKTINHRVVELLKAVDLEDKFYSLPQTLSGGEQQRIAVARALIHNPSLIIADEPTGNLDEDMTSRVFDLFSNANSLGITVIVASHNLTMIETLGQRTLVLDRGSLIGDFAKLSRDKRTRHG